MGRKRGQRQRGERWLNAHMAHQMSGSLLPVQIEARRVQARNLFAEQDRRCYYCGRPCQLHKKALGFRDSFTLDHKQPTARGGEDSKSNLVGACRDCNGQKGAMTLEEWRLYRVRHGHSREFWGEVVRNDDSPRDTKKTRRS